MITSFEQRHSTNDHISSTGTIAEAKDWLKTWVKGPLIETIVSLIKLMGTLSKSEAVPERKELHESTKISSEKRTITLLRYRNIFGQTATNIGKIYLQNCSAICAGSESSYWPALTPSRPNECSGAIIDFTLSNARRFCSSVGNLLDRKGLNTDGKFYFEDFLFKTSLGNLQVLSFVNLIPVVNWRLENLVKKLCLSGKVVKKTYPQHFL